MTFKIERALTGLFPAYKLFSQGNLPRTMLETVQPTIDLTTFAARAEGLKIRTLTGTTPETTGVMVTYEQTVDWLVMGGDVIQVAGAANSIAFDTLQFRTTKNDGEVAYCGRQQTTSLGLSIALATGQISYSNFKNFSVPIWTPAGTQWEYICSYVGAVAPATCTAQIVYYAI